MTDTIEHKWSNDTVYPRLKEKLDAFLTNGDDASLVQALKTINELWDDKDTRNQFKYIDPLSIAYPLPSLEKHEIVEVKGLLKAMYARDLFKNLDPLTELQINGESFAAIPARECGMDSHTLDVILNSHNRHKVLRDTALTPWPQRFKHFGALSLFREALGTSLLMYVFRETLSGNPSFSIAQSTLRAAHVMSTDRTTQSMAIVAPHIMHQLETKSLMNRESASYAIKPFSMMISGLTGMVAYAACGSNTFVLDDDLVRTLRDTETMDADYLDVVLPFSSFYMTFGNKHRPLKFTLEPTRDRPSYRPTMTLDGVLVRKTSSHINMQGTLVDRPGIEIILMSAPFENAICPRPIAILAISFYDADEPGTNRIPIRELLGVYDNVAVDSKDSIGDDQARVIKDALCLAINALLYMSHVATEDGVTIDEPRAASGLSSDQVRSAEANASRSGVPDPRIHPRKLVTKLTRGLMPANPKTHESPSEPGLTGRQMPRHRRRAHWKNQPHGPGRTLRKYILIEETIVNPHRPESKTVEREYRIVDDKR